MVLDVFLLKNVIKQEICFVLKQDICSYLVWGKVEISLSAIISLKGALPSPLYALDGILLFSLLSS